MENKVVFSIQFDRTGNKFLQLGVYRELKDKLSSIIYDPQVQLIYDLISGDGDLGLTL